MIQQSRVELDEKVYQPFLRRNGDDAVAFEDYAACIDLQKIIHDAHNAFRTEAIKHLAVNPDDHLNWRNAIRRCQHCREVWVKVEGCDGATTCGARPSCGDIGKSDHYFRLCWERVDGFLRPAKFSMRRQMSTAATSDASKDVRPIGCGGSIVWKDQAVVSQMELDSLFTTQELENILSSFKMASRFQRLRRKKEKKIKAFGELDDDGKDLPIVDEKSGGDSSDDQDREETGGQL
eukprot:UN1143